MREPNEIDFWRGFALVTIFINHIPGNFFERFTYRNLSLSDSAELFVFLAGWALRLQTIRTKLPMPGLVVRLAARAVQVYCAQLVITEMAVALLAGASIYFDAAFLLDWHNASAIFHDPVEAHIGLVLLTHQLGYFNILPLYVVLVACAPFVALCARYARLLLLPLSAGLYVLTLSTGINLGTWPVEGTWFLNPMAWQFIFILGFSLAGKDGIGGLARRHRKALMLVALPIVGLGMLVALTHFSPRPADMPSPKLFFVFDKTFLSPARLIHFLAVVAVFSGSFPFVMRWFAVGGRFFSMLGRNSLIVFCVASLLSLAGQIARFAYGGALLTDAMIAGAGLAFMGIIAWLSERRDGWRHGAADMRASPSS
ncbi:MAG: OpgC domain-containing protein [Methylovirgula sp.]